MGWPSSMLLRVSRLSFFRSCLALGLLVGLPTNVYGQVETRFLLQASSVHEFTTASEQLINQGRQRFAREQFAAAAASWETAAANYAAQGDAANQALSLNYLSLAYQALGRWSEAKQAIQQSLQLLRGLVEVDSGYWANSLNTQANLQLEMGQPEQAIETWTEAKRYYQLAQDLEGTLGVQLNQVRAWQYLGFYRRARLLLTDVQHKLALTQDASLRIKGLHSLGITLQSLGELEESRVSLSESLALAQQQGATADASAIFLSLGNVARAQSQPQQALDYFRQAEQASSQPLNRFEAQLNQLRLCVELNRMTAVQDLVANITGYLDQLPIGRRSIYGTINFVESLLMLRPNQVGVSPRKIDRLLLQALNSSRQLKDDYAEAYVLTQQGKSYAHFRQTQNAIATTEQALALAQSVRAANVTSQAAWQLGKLYHQQGQRESAIAAYRQAVMALQSLRGDIASVAVDLQFSFRDRVEPVYRELVDLLLTPSTPTQTHIKEARDLIEDLQLAELDNFFREACADLQPVNIDEIDPNSAVIYPIVLADRIAIIVSRPQKDLQLYSVNRPQAQIAEDVDLLLEGLSIVYDSRERNMRSQQVYDWLIRPAEEDQALTGVNTLVFVLDKGLRSVPLAALHDGQQYLIEKYSLALSPGLQLLKPRPLAKTGLNVVSGGLSQARQGYPALPAVQTELNHLTETLKTSVLLDHEFTRPQLAEQLTESPASIVHLATHGQFSSDIDQTFLLTWDNRLKLKDFTQLLADRDIQQTRDLELLVLSACQTAVGDDRAVLGIAGFAVRSGARSTLATLWAVRDRSTALFMNKFYYHLRQPGVTKAVAVQRAQIALLQSTDYKDPFFWAPFVLVGNWL